MSCLSKFYYPDETVSNPNGLPVSVSNHTGLFDYSVSNDESGAMKVVAMSNPDGYNSIPVERPEGVSRRCRIMSYSRAHVWRCDKCNTIREFDTRRGLDLWMRLHRKTCKGKKDE